MADVEIDLEISNPQELVGLGIRAYAIGDFSSAAAAFGRATQLMAEQKGDEHDSLGEIYIHYAKSLLEVSREESGALGDAIPHGDESSDSEEDTEAGSSNGTTEKDENAEEDDSKKEETKEVDAGMKEETSKEENADKIEENVEKKEDSAEKNKVEDKVEDKDEKKKEEKTEVEKKEEEKKGDEKVQNGEETSKETGEKKTNGESSKTEEETPENTEESEENCTDLQLAWEVLEVAKKIFKNRGDSGKQHLAESLILLGEVAMESENFQDGVNDMSAGIEIQRELFEPTSRKLAESYYKLGIAHSTISNIDEAVESFNNSIDILKKRIKFLKESLGEKTDDSKANNKNEEIEEMELLIPEIEEKIADTKSIKEDMAAELMKEMSASGDNKQKTPPKDAPTSSKANDISHLVKRKRKANEDIEESEAQPTKRPTP